MKPIYLLALAGTVITAVATTPAPTIRGEFDYEGLNTQVQKHEQQIDNHETRITTLEATTQTTTPIVQPTVTPTSTPESSPAPVTLVSIKERREGNMLYCDYTYSDGSTKTEGGWDQRFSGVTSCGNAGIGQPKN